MINAQYINLNMIPSGVLPILNVSQYDIGRPLGLVVCNGGEAVDLDVYTCTIEATRTDGTAITTNVTTNDNVGTFVTTAVMTNKADMYGAQLVLFDSNSRRVASLPFMMRVVKAAMDENAESIEEDASLYQQYTGAVQAMIAEINETIESMYHDTVAQMVADTALDSGMYVRTGGYYAVNDRGGALYRIYDSAPASGYYETLSNGKYAAIIFPDNCINMAALGLSTSVDFNTILQRCLTYYGATGYTYYAPKGTYTASSVISLTALAGITITGDGEFATVINAANGIKIYGCNGLTISKMRLVGNNQNIGIEVADNTPTTADCRANNLHLENIYIDSFQTGIAINAPTGYVYIDQCRVYNFPSGGVGINIGENYQNQVSVLPGYIYITNTKVEDLYTHQCDYGVKIVCGQWVYLENNDICNIINGTAVYMHIPSNAGSRESIDHVQVMMNSLFNVKNAVVMLRENATASLRNVCVNNNSITLTQESNDVNGMLIGVTGYYIVGFQETENDIFYTDWSKVSYIARIKYVTDANLGIITGNDSRNPLYQKVSVEPTLFDSSFWGFRAFRQQVVGANSEITLTFGDINGMVSANRFVFFAPYNYAAAATYFNNVDITRSFDDADNTLSCVIKNNNNYDRIIQALMC